MNRHRRHVGLALAVVSLGTSLCTRAAHAQQPTSLDGPPAPVAPAVITRASSGQATVRAIKLAAPLTLDGVLSRYARERQLIDELSSASLPTIGSAAWLIKEQAAVSLWQDFQERGPLSTWSNVLSSDPTGKPNWSRSLGSNQWIKSPRKNQFLPASVIYTSRAKHRDDLFSSIYLWLASLGAQVDGAALSVRRVKPIVSPIEASVIVKREQRRAYRRRDRRV